MSEINSYIKSRVCKVLRFLSQRPSKFISEMLKKGGFEIDGTLMRCKLFSDTCSGC